MPCRKPAGSPRQHLPGSWPSTRGKTAFPRALVTAAFLGLLLAAPAAEEKKFTVYSPQGTLTLFVVDRNSKEYVSLTDAVGMLGDSVVKIDGKKWKLRFTPLRAKAVEAQFERGKTRAKLRGRNLELAAPFLLEDRQGLVPVSSLPDVISALVEAPIDLRESARRLFVGQVGAQFVTDLQKGAPPKLLFHFPVPVTPTIATEPGHLRMMFTRDPLAGPPGTQSFDDKVITSAAFSESNGAAEIAVTGTEPLFASFTDAGKTIVVTAVPSPRVQAAPPPSPPPAPAPSPAASQPPKPLPLPQEVRYTVVIDPGHGGQEVGAMLGPSLPEKDVTLAWGRRLKAALEKRGISSLLLRDGDIALSADQRASVANGARPEVFLSLHAGSTGSGVHVFTAQLASALRVPGALIPWDAAQASYLDSSRDLAERLAAELLKLDIPSSRAPAMMRPLNNVAAPAVAIELAPQQGNVQTLNDPNYQQTVCNAIADAIAAARGQLGALR